MKNTELMFFNYIEYFLAQSYHQLGKFFSLVMNFFLTLYRILYFQFTFQVPQFPHKG